MVYATNVCLEKSGERGKLEDIGVDGDDKKVEFCILD